MELGLAVAFSIAFALTNGFHDAANAIATLVATRGASAGQAIVLAAVFNMLGALLVGTAVADTIAGIVTVAPGEAVAVIGAGVLAATLWNLLTWSRGLPSSSAHALVGGLVGSAIAAAGIDAVQWGGLEGWKPVGVFGVLIVLAVSPCSAWRSASPSRASTGACCGGRPARSGPRSAPPSGRCRPPSPSATAPTTPRRRWV